MRLKHQIRPEPATQLKRDPQIERDSSSIAEYLEDAAHFPGGHASGIARPTSTADVSTLVQNAKRILPVGAQSSLTGGATPLGDLVIATDRLDRITSYNGTEISAQAGVPIEVLQETLANQNAYYPPVPTFGGAFSGGVVATNAAGATTFKYGTTRDWVNGLTVVLADGSILKVSRGEIFSHTDGFFELISQNGTCRIPVPSYKLPNVPKCSAGYFASEEMDLIDLFIGSEGTLGIITEIRFKVITPRPTTVLVWLTLPKVSKAFSILEQLRAESRLTWKSHDSRGLDVVSVEHIDRNSLDLLRADKIDQIFSVSIPVDTEVSLLAQIEVPADSVKMSSDAYKQIGEALSATAPDTPLVRLCRLLSAADVLERTEIVLPQDQRRKNQLFGFREAVPEAINRRIKMAQQKVDSRIKKIAADMIVPFSLLRESIELFEHAFRKRNLEFAIWGHISDANLHPNIIPRDLNDARQGEDAVLECGKKIVALGGCPLAEHGVGRNTVKQTLLKTLYGHAGIQQMRNVKKALDPSGKLAPGVLFPER
tara:strand:+ start:507 stop:2126 length:1620 start_codon:yes stop_codon:yes gene_type:complete